MIPNVRSVLLLGTLWMALLGAGVNAATVVFVTGEWPPFTGETLPDRGFFTKYAELLAKDMGVEASIVFVPWTRAESMLRRGEAFAAFPYRQTASRVAEFDFSAPVTKTYSRLFFQKSKLGKLKDFQSLDALKPYVIGVTRGSGSAEELGRAEVSLEFAPSDQHLMLMFQANRFDMAAVNEHVGWYFLQQMSTHAAERYGMVGLPLKQYDTMFMVSRAYPDQRELLDKMNRSIQRLHRSKVYDTLAAQAFGER